MMKTREAVATLATAGVTLVAALAFLWPLGVGAADGPTRIEIVQPKMTVGTCQFTLGGPLLRAEEGAKMTLTLRTVNTGSEAAKAKVWLAIYATSPESEVSRRPMIPAFVWAKECSVALDAKGKETIEIPLDVPLPAGQSIHISLVEKDPTPTPAARPGAVAAQISQAQTPAPDQAK
jgi:hypothetical protein